MGLQHTLVNLWMKLALQSLFIFPLPSSIFDLSAPPPFAPVQYERTYYSSRLAILPLTVLSKDPSYDPDNTTLFLTCPRSTSVATPGPVIYDSSGELVWADPNFGECFNLRPQTHNGRPVLTLWAGKFLGGYGDGAGVILDQSYSVTRNVTAINPLNTDFHEFYVTDNETALFTAYNHIQADLSSVGGSSNGWYVDSLIQEVEILTGKVLFNWSSFEHLFLNESFTSPISPIGDTVATPWDAVHFNSVEKDHDGNYLVSSRHCKTVYKIDGITGEVIWRLGGKLSDFATGNGTVFHWQHDARWHEGDTKISLFDNGASDWEHNAKTARGLYLSIDQKARTVTLDKEWLPSRRNYSLSQGGAHIYDNQTSVLVGYGSNPWLTDYSFSDPSKILFNAVLGPNDPALFNGPIHNYRAFKASTTIWEGKPSAPPDVFVAGPNGPVYVSWNGATHVKSYSLVGSETVHLTNANVTVVPRSGFETTITPKTTLSRYVRVHAHGPNGKILGTSHIYSSADGSVVHSSGSGYRIAKQE